MTELLSMTFSEFREFVSKNNNKTNIKQLRHLISTSSLHTQVHAHTNTETNKVIKIKSHQIFRTIKSHFLHLFMFQIN